MSNYDFTSRIVAASTSGDGVGTAFTNRANMEGNTDANFATVTFAGAGSTETVTFTFEPMDLASMGLGPNVSDVTFQIGFRGQATGTLAGNVVFTFNGETTTLAVVVSGVMDKLTASVGGPPPGATVQSLIDGLTGTLRFTAISGAGDIRITTGILNLSVSAPVPSVVSVTGAANRQARPVKITSPGDSLATNFILSAFVNLTLYQADGTTAIADGDAITLAQGAAGVVPTPVQGFVGLATFDVQGCTSSDPGDVVGDPRTVTVPILNSTRGRSYRSRQSVSAAGAVNVPSNPFTYP